MPATSEAHAKKADKDDPDKLLTPDEAATEAGRSRQTIYNWINNKKNPLKASKPGREWWIRRGDLIEYQLLLISEAAQDDIEATESAVVHTSPATPAEVSRTNLVAGRFTSIKPVPPHVSQVDTVASFELLLNAAEIALKIRRYTYSAQAARKVNDIEWAERLEGLIYRLENDLMETIAPFSLSLIDELRGIVQTTPIKNLFGKFEDFRDSLP